MDSILNAAGLALSKGDLLGALNRVALRQDPAALALRGIVMAQLGELNRARDLLQQAAKGFGPSEGIAHARCVVAEAEIALVSRDLTWSSDRLDRARHVLEDRGDTGNAAYAAVLAARHNLLLGRLDRARDDLLGIEESLLPPAVLATSRLTLAGIAVRERRSQAAYAALDDAELAARRSGFPSLVAEVSAARRLLARPVASLRHQGEETFLTLDGVEQLLLTDALVVDAATNCLRQAGRSISLRTRPVLLKLIVMLASAWPAGVAREDLLRGAFGARHLDESHRIRLRVEIARLRKVIGPIAGIRATGVGFRLVPQSGDVAVLAVPFAGEGAEIMALLADGELWSSSALALALDSSPRSVQRSVSALQEAGKIQAVGRGRARRWISLAFPGFPLTLLLPGAH